MTMTSTGACAKRENPARLSCRGCFQVRVALHPRFTERARFLARQWTRHADGAVLV